MTKLYLIRRNLENFIGPLSAPEVKDAFQKMQFGLQDEIAGHCGPWVTLDQAEKIRKYYPEVARVVLEDLASWGVSNHDGGHVTHGSARAAKKKRTNPFAGLGWAIALLLVATVALSSAIYFAVTGKTLGLAREQDNPFLFDEIKALVERQDDIGFLRLMDKNLSEIVERTMRPKKPESQWVPFLRKFAFSGHFSGVINGLGTNYQLQWQTNGAIEGIPARVLRGEGMSHTPLDCSLKAWNTRWRAAIKSFNELVQQGKLVNAQWARILAWDPHWIRRRDHKGWLKGDSYYLGCTVMAEQAIKDLFSDASLVSSASDWDKLGINRVKNRLVWLLGLQKSGSGNQFTLPQPGDFLSLWTCYESAQEVKQLAQCREAYTTPLDEASLAYADERFGWNLLRIILGTKGLPSAEVLQAMNQLLPKLQKGDQYNRFDYRSEIKIWKNILKQPMPIEKVIERSLVETPEIKFIP